MSRRSFLLLGVRRAPGVLPGKENGGERGKEGEEEEGSREEEWKREREATGYGEKVPEEEREK